MAPYVGEVVRYVLNSGRNRGQHRPAMIVRVWEPLGDDKLVQLQVFTDSENDGLPPVMWQTSVRYDEGGEFATWHFPPRSQE